MPRRCSVYGCHSNYDTEKESTSTFSLPRDENQRKLWLRHIPTNFSRLKNPNVCIKHFVDSDIIRIDRVFWKGELKEYSRKIPKLKASAVPSVFPNNLPYCPKGRPKEKVPPVEEGATKEGMMQSGKSEVIEHIYRPEMIKTEIKEEVGDVNELSSENKLIKEEASAHTEVIWFPLHENNTDNQETSVKLEIKEEPIKIEDTSFEINSDSNADLLNEKKVAVSENEELQRLYARPENGNGTAIFSFALKEEQESNDDDDDGCDSETASTQESQTYNIPEKNNDPVKQTKVFKAYKCEICDTSFLRSFSLKRHKLIHDNVKKYKCETCDKTFRCPLSLRRHSISHNDQQPYTCDICDKSFKRLLYLNRHKLTHDDNKKHKCVICEKAFKCLPTLKRHKAVYHGKNIHQCEVCKETFASELALKKHILDGKPHKCDICDKSFQYKSQLKKHSVVHEYSRPFNCEVCKMSFKLLSHLRGHMIIHEEVKPYKCEICEKSFARTSALNRHYFRHQFYSGTSQTAV